jgi:hypothetical protein
MSSDQIKATECVVTLSVSTHVKDDKVQFAVTSSPATTKVEKKEQGHEWWSDGEDSEGHFLSEGADGGL